MYISINLTVCANHFLKCQLYDFNKKIRIIIVIFNFHCIVKQMDMFEQVSPSLMQVLFNRILINKTKSYPFHYLKT